VSGEQCVAAGNMLAGRAVIEAMVRAFEDGEGQLADRLLAACTPPGRRWRSRPGAFGRVVVVGELTWPIIDLRGWADENPIGQLQTLWDAYRPQCRTTSTAPSTRPSRTGYGVAGDDR
jgi:uncharacterized Ntn-hydrolase superfamily protein